MVLAIHQHELAIIIHMSLNSWTPTPELPPHSTPLGCHRCSEAFIRLPLVICFTYGNVHVSMLLSQFTPPSPSPTVSTVCSLCLCLQCGIFYLNFDFAHPILWSRRHSFPWSTGEAAGLMREGLCSRVHKEVKIWSSLSDPRADSLIFPGRDQLFHSSGVTWSNGRVESPSLACQSP